MGDRDDERLRQLAACGHLERMIALSIDREKIMSAVEIAVQACSPDTPSYDAMCGALRRCLRAFGELRKAKEIEVHEARHNEWMALAQAVIDLAQQTNREFFPSYWDM